MAVMHPGMHQTPGMDALPPYRMLPLPLGCSRLVELSVHPYPGVRHLGEAGGGTWWGSPACAGGGGGDWGEQLLPLLGGGRSRRGQEADPSQGRFRSSGPWFSGAAPGRRCAASCLVDIPTAPC